jgi:sporulation protein YlmC with PRC-barrel domain
MAKKIQSVSDLVPDDRNANDGTERGSALLESSLRDLGAGRSIVVDREGRVIAGNKTLQAAVDAGVTEIEVVQSDGHKLVVVQRIDLDLKKHARAKKLAVSDNRIGELNLTWNPGVIDDLSKEIEMIDVGFAPDELKRLLQAPGNIPANFRDIDEHTNCKCPKCGYKWKEQR